LRVVVVHVVVSVVVHVVVTCEDTGWWDGEMSRDLELTTTWLMHPTKPFLSGKSTFSQNAESLFAVQKTSLLLLIYLFSQCFVCIIVIFFCPILQVESHSKSKI
jgi:hypothetical protein